MKDIIAKKNLYFAHSQTFKIYDWINEEKPKEQKKSTKKSFICECDFIKVYERGKFMNKI